MHNPDNINSNDCFLFIRPKKGLSPLILTSPHSGDCYDKKFLELTGKQFRSYKLLEDMYVNDIIYGLDKFGASLLLSKMSRAMIDLNRNLKEIDKTMVSDVPLNEIMINKLVKSGIGLFPKYNENLENLYERGLSWSDAEDIIRKYYLPWHLELKNIIKMIHKKFNCCFLLDFHSMPSKSQKFSSEKKDIILGNIYGSSCDELMLSFIKNKFINLGYSVGINDPYAGGYITRNYNNRSKNIQTLQIEISRDLYMCEDNFNKTENFELLKKNISKIICSFLNFIQKDVVTTIAAE